MLHRFKQIHLSNRLLLLLLLSLIFNQCTLEKRHYRKGWYLVKHKGKNSAIPEYQQNNYSIENMNANTLMCSNNNILHIVSKKDTQSEITIKVLKKNTIKKNDFNLEKDSASVKKILKVDKYGNSKKSVIAYWMVIVSILSELLGAALAIFGMILNLEIIAVSGLVLLMFLALILIPLLITVLILTKKESNVQKKKIGKIHLIKMFLSGEYKSNKAIFARKLFIKMFWFNLFLILIVAVFGLLFANS
jgi:hypothetical protein